MTQTSGATRIRRVTSSDFKAVKALMHQAFPSRAAKNKPADIKAYVSVYEGADADARTPFLVAENDSGVVVGYGFATLHSAEINGRMTLLREGETGMINQIAVAPAARHAGLGAQLHQALVVECLAAGFTQIFAHIAESSVPFYLQRGWKIGVSGRGWVWIEKNTPFWTRFLQQRGVAHADASEWSPLLTMPADSEGDPFVAVYHAADHPLAAGMPSDPRDARGIGAALRLQLEAEPAQLERVPRHALDQLLADA